MAKIEEIDIHVVSESPSYSVQVSEHPVENGANIADHVKAQPVGFEISGMVVGDDATKKKRDITMFMNEGRTVKYSGRNSVSSCLITNFTTEHDSEIANGFRFSMSLRVFKFATIEVQGVPVNPVDRTQTAKPTNSGLEQPAGGDRS